MNEQHLYPKGNNFITDWEKYRKKHYFCDTFVINRKRQTEPLAVIAGLTRYLPSKKESSLRSGDCGCSSAMTAWC